MDRLVLRSAERPLRRGVTAPLRLALALVLGATTAGCADGQVDQSPRDDAAAPADGDPPAAGEPMAPSDAVGPYPVAEVIDGDTVAVVVEGRPTTLRLIGIDTPETRDPQRTVECFGPEASSRAATLLGDERVRLSYDPTQGRTDRYGRTLAYVWLPDGRSFQWQLLLDGYAAEYTYDLPYRYRAEFRAAERSARDADRGLWAPGTCGGDLDLPASSPPTTGGPSPGGPFESCADARSAGASPLHEGDSGYDPGLDGDGDGVACE